MKVLPKIITGSFIDGKQPYLGGVFRFSAIRQKSPTVRYSDRGDSGGLNGCDTSYTGDFSSGYPGLGSVPDSAKQLKHWLDPVTKNSPVMNGLDPYSPILPID
jgi:hypothetical protein